MWKQCVECSDYQLDAPPTRDINVRVIGICAAPVGAEPHDGGDGEVCLCFGPRSNGFNATGIQRNGECARSQIGPFCFVDTLVGPLFWKETVTNQTGSTTLIPGEIVPISVPCPPGKMVLSCEGRVTVGDTNEPAASVSSNIFPAPNGLACRHVARTDFPPPDPCDLRPCKFFDVPKTADCWRPPPDCDADPIFDTPVSSPPLDCDLSTSGDPSKCGQTGIFIGGQSEDCEILSGNPTCVPNPIDEPVDTGPLQEACRSCLELYTTELNQTVPVSGQQPFMCFTVPPP